MYKKKIQALKAIMAIMMLISQLKQRKLMRMEERKKLIDFSLDISLKLESNKTEVSIN